MKRTLLINFIVFIMFGLSTAASSVACTQANTDGSISPGALTKAEYSWTRATEKYGWGHGKVYVLNLLAFDGKLWAFEDNEALHYSSDGKNWLLATSRAGWPGSVLAGRAVVFDNKMWALGMRVGKQIRNEVWSSRDGKTWTRATGDAAWPLRGGQANLAFAGKIWILGGGNDKDQNDVWYSSDGLQWIRATEHAQWSARGGHKAVVFKDKIWVLGGGAREELYNDVWHSSDGVNWIRATSDAEWGQRRNFTTVVFDNKLWVLGGIGKNDPTAKNDAWYSEDGVHWKQATANAGWFPRSALSSAVLDNKLWVMGGKTGVSANSNPQDVWYMSLLQR